MLVSSNFSQNAIRRHLSFLSDELTFVHTVHEARMFIVAGEMDVVCVEGILPDGSGMELCTEIRKHPSGHNIPILLLTGSEDPNLEIDAKAAGITQMFYKANLDALADYIAEYEKASRTAGALTGNVLLVEDSPTISNFLSEILRNMGLTVTTLANAEDAFEIFRKRKFDIVISDVELEGDLTGLGLVRAIRRLDEPFCRVPFLAISGTTSKERQFDVIGYGANDFVAKPVTPKELEVRVHNMVKHKQLFDQVEAQRDHLRRLALTDQLTGLFNRHYMSEVGSRRMTEAMKYGIPVSLLLLDLDHFKKINDTMGHDVGDIVLFETAKVIRECCLSGDIASRAGGEEFCVTLINRDRTNAIGFAENLLKKIEASLPEGIFVTGSIGLATVTKGMIVDFKTLFKAADEAMYKAKSGGRNRVESAIVEPQAANQALTENATLGKPGAEVSSA